MTHDNPARRSWQRKPPLTPEQEVPKHSRRASRKRYGIRLRWPWPWRGGREYNQWYETPQARTDALDSLMRSDRAGDVIGLVERP